MINHAVVVAIGNAVHQSKLIYNRPRAMLPALGKPLVVRVMDRLLRGGVRSIRSSSANRKARSPLF